MRERKRREWGEIWSEGEDGREMDERIRKRREKIENERTTPEKAESEEEDGVENELENNENIEDCDSRKTIKVKPFGGPLLAQTEISSSQQDFFKMLDEKIQNVSTLSFLIVQYREII
ncbi:hypothetical protein MTP99_015861 [Tenebrio molitor]|nr:hypothetical protein MTP99_015861 [Tenebrio molitor]